MYLDEKALKGYEQLEKDFQQIETLKLLTETRRFDEQFEDLARIWKSIRKNPTAGREGFLEAGRKEL